MLVKTELIMRTKRSSVFSILFLCSIIVVVLLSAVSTQIYGQRIFGAQRFSMDDNNGALTKTITLDATTPLVSSYGLHFPAAPPPGPSSVLVSDAFGNLTWGNATLPSLPFNNIWIGNAFNQAQPYAPTVAGAIFILSPSLTPSWSTTLPPAVTVPFGQITSGTNSGQSLQVGAGSTLSPVGGGTISANSLVGAGAGKYSGSVAIPLNASSLFISDPSISALSAVVVSVTDPNSAQGTVSAFVQSISGGSGFTVFFAADYPRATGQLHYIVTNP